MRVLILLISILTSASVVEAMKWPIEGYCSPCQCSVQQSKYSYGLIKLVNCSGLGLTELPKHLPRDLDCLDLSNNNFDIAIVDPICDFKFLQYLSLAQNTFTSIDWYLFSNCSLLIKLDLTGSSIFHLTNGSFSGLDNLQTIYGLEAVSVDVGVFMNLQKLKTLEFTFLGETIPEMIFTGLPVETLHLTMYKVEKIPQRLLEFGEKTLQVISINGPEVSFVYENFLRGLTVLRKVYMNMPKLVSLPERIFNNFGVMSDDGDPRNLQEIVLMSMNSVPGTIFKDLESLHRLEIHDVNEVASPGIFDDLVNLEVLDLTRSNVNQVPTGWFSNLYSLKTLNLSQSNLREIEEHSMDGLMNLKTLDLSMNALRNIHLKTFDPLRKSVQNLHLQGNILKGISDQLFSSMLALQYLDLSDNKIAMISSNAFSDLKLLNSLQLQENKLAYLPVDLFKHQPNLQVLHLGANSFQRFPISVLKSAGFLLRLYLEDNKIPSAPPSLSTDLPYLEYLSVMNNPVQCRCRLLSLRLFMPNLYIDGLCMAPRAYSGRHVMSLVVPANCKGPRPKPEIRPEIPEITFTSMLDPDPPPEDKDYKENYHYYGNNYYGSDDYYEYDTNQYYLDLQSDEKAPPSSVGVTGIGTRSWKYPEVSMSTRKQTDRSQMINAATTSSLASMTQMYSDGTSDPPHLHGSTDANFSLPISPTPPLIREFESNETESAVVTTSIQGVPSPTDVPCTSFTSESQPLSKEHSYTDSGTPDKERRSCSDDTCKEMATDFLPPEDSVAEGDDAFTGRGSSSSAQEDSNIRDVDKTEDTTSRLRSTSTQGLPTSSHGQISPSSSVDLVDNTAVSEKPHGGMVGDGETGMSPTVQAVVGVLAVAAFICICVTLWWLRKQVKTRRMYEVTPSSTVV
ncbi:insulin-like growth factor-binding protein complex acid labile subunit [Haliotis rufescens]|uniref:insulin-like growth factor-binding protein complex acid labile subunit n=1 Tax=Haliotis rufescens TaxID=6454 RepID=UPI001EAF98A6|nr:insulin-like growth factor-binding protein complex acid labile subunit [Haliotis rufescens]XP_046372848.1 insulin-like growth factor-binding protein complex acid labile subunit [Haliotis rufescens]XP_046372849.1 insulin-like growth factor-binding protein complex acid labile subunit [Haliotis rufescens]